MWETTEGIVLRTQKYGDDRLIANVYTASRGMVGFLLRARRSGKSSLLRPLSLVEVSFDFRTRQELQHVRELRSAHAYSSLMFDPMKEMLAIFLAEFLSHILRSEGPNAALYTYLRHSLQWLDTTSRGVSNFHLVLLIHMTRHLGFWPAVETSRSARARKRESRTAVFDMQEGMLTDSLPLHGQYLSAEESALMPTLLRMDFHTLHLFHFTRAQRNRLLDVLLQYYQLHIPEVPALKSLPILREVLN